MVTLNINNIDKQYHNAIQKLGKRYNFTIGSEGLGVYIKRNEQANLEIIKQKNEINITYQKTCDLLRGIGECVRRLATSQEDFRVSYERQFKSNGVMVDCSRNGVINVTYMKEIIDTLAIIGHNTLMLYMEDIYTIDEEPYFGYMRGRYTKEELKEIDTYAADMGIEVIPCIQTLAHIDQFFRWEQIREKYIDIDNILLVNTEETNQLIENMIKSLAECFTSKKIHVGMDEAYNLGRGKYIDRFGLRSKQYIMREHLKTIVSITNKYGMRPIIWDDMFFNHYGVGDGDEASIPDGVDLMYWDYYNNTKEHYTERINQRKALGTKVMFAGGAWRWIGYVPHHSKTFVASNAALMACKEEGIQEVIATAWADDGCEAPVSTLLFGAVLFGEHGYNYEVNEEDFKDKLKFYTGMSYEHHMKQEEFDILPDMKNPANTTNLSKYLFYEDPLCSLFIKHIEAVKIDLTSYYEALEDDFKKMSKAYQKDSNNGIIMDLYAAYAAVLKYKWNLGKNILEAYKNKDKVALTEICIKQIEPIIVALKAFRKCRLKEWTYCNKSFGFEVLDYRIGGMIQRLYTAKEQIQAYNNDEIEKIAELEEERLPLTHYKEEGMGEIIHYNQAQKSMTASRIIW